MYKCTKRKVHSGQQGEEQVLEYNEVIHEWVDAVVNVKTKTEFCDDTLVIDDHLATTSTTMVPLLLSTEKRKQMYCKELCYTISCYWQH